MTTTTMTTPLTRDEVERLDRILHGPRPVDPAVARSVLAYHRIGAYGDIVDVKMDDVTIRKVPWPADWYDWHPRAGAEPGETIPAVYPAPEYPGPLDLTDPLLVFIEDRKRSPVSGHEVETGWAFLHTVIRTVGITFTDADLAQVRWTPPGYNDLDILVDALRDAVRIHKRIAAADAIRLLRAQGLDLAAPTFGRAILTAASHLLSPEDTEPVDRVLYLFNASTSLDPPYRCSCGSYTFRRQLHLDGTPSTTNYRCASCGFYVEGTQT
jgi:hypothetical protein